MAADAERARGLEMETVGRNDHAAGERSEKSGRKAEGDGGGTIGADTYRHRPIGLGAAVDGFGTAIFS